MIEEDYYRDTFTAFARDLATIYINLQEWEKVVDKQHKEKFLLACFGIEQAMSGIEAILCQLSDSTNPTATNTD